MSLLSLLGCSPASTELPAKLADLRVEISIEDDTNCTLGTHYTRKSVKAVLAHARGGAIERGDVKIEVNGTPLEFRVGQGNYYDRHPYYQLPDDAKLKVTPGTEYRFTLILPDSSPHEIGTVRTPAALDVAQIDFPEQRPATGAVAFGWRDLAEPAELVLSRSETWREPDGTRVLQGGSANDPEALRRTIGPGWFKRGTDRWTLPEKFLSTRDGHAVRALHADVRVTREGRVAKTFAPKSTLRAERSLSLEMEFLKVD